jgi:hypothetical protein
MNSTKKNIRAPQGRIYEFKWGYESGNYLVKEENGDLLEDSYNILNKWKI